MRRWVVFVLLALASAKAYAQPAPQVFDPRTALQAVNALQAVLALREAEMKALHEDFDKREHDWAAYSAPLWQAPEPAKP